MSILYNIFVTIFKKQNNMKKTIFLLALICIIPLLACCDKENDPDIRLPQMDNPKNYPDTVPIPTLPI